MRVSVNLTTRARMGNTPSAPWTRKQKSQNVHASKLRTNKSTYMCIFCIPISVFLTHLHHKKVSCKRSYLMGQFHEIWFLFFYLTKLAHVTDVLKYSRIFKFCWDFLLESFNFSSLVHWHQGSQAFSLKLDLAWMLVVPLHTFLSDYHLKNNKKSWQKLALFFCVMETTKLE